MSASRTASVEIKANAKGVGPGLSDARRQLRAFEREQARSRRQAERDAESSRKRLVSSARGIAGGLGHGIMAGLGLEAAGGLSGFATSVLDVESSLVRLQITGEQSSGWINDFRSDIDRVSSATGVSREKLLASAHAYTKVTGEAEEARTQLQLFAEVMNGSGSAPEAIARTAAALRTNLGIIGSNDMRAAFDILVKQGHKGSIELEDMAQHAMTLLPFMTKMGGTNFSKLAEAGAASQVMFGAFGDPAETATGFRDMMSSLIKDAPKLAQFGVKIFEIDPTTKKKVERNLTDILTDIKHSALSGDPELLRKVIPDIRAYRGLDMLLEKYDEFVALKNESVNSDQVAKDNAIWMSSTAGQMERAWNNIKLAVVSAFTPERIKVFADLLSTAAEKFMEAARWIDAHGDPDKNPNARSDDADEVLARLHERYPNLSKERLGQIGVQLQNLDLHTGGELPDEIKHMGGNAHSFAGLREAGERLGVETGSVSGGYLVHRDEYRAGATDYFHRMGIKSPYEQAQSTSLGRMQDAIVKAINNGFANAGIKIGSEPLVKAMMNSPLHNTRPGGYR